LAFVFGLTPLVAAQAGDGGAGVAEPVNTLRVYGEAVPASGTWPDDVKDAAFPYTTAAGPLAIAGNETPPKDFIQWNPAYMYHLDPESNGIYGNFFRGIVVNAGDANEKVHLRQWYVPDYPEPRGKVFKTTPEQEPVLSPDIVKEYTYILLDTKNDPVAGEEGRTSFVFPIADNSNQIGIDDYDANRDGTADRVWLNSANATAPNTIDISTMGLTVSEGDVLQFLDHKAIITGISTSGVTADIYYQGNRGSGGYDDDELLGSSGLLVPTTAPTATAGRHLVNDLGITAIEEPWYITAISSGATTASVQVGRLIQEGETFFVDGAEYDIAALYMPEDKFLKYITVRNPLPKVPVTLERLTIEKLPLEKDTSFPMLPPFNMEHDIIDDINIPHVNYVCDPSFNKLSPDEQAPDNVITEKDLKKINAAKNDCITGADGYGDQSGLKMEYNTIKERRVEDVDPIDDVLIEKWVSETKEPRFDQNLLEEKFTAHPDEDWQWINIETKPWDYTELVLPGLLDKPTETGYTTGDYILVSSFLAPNSKTDAEDEDVRVKFCYDAAYGPAKITGLYVNTIGGVEVNQAPNAPTNPSPADDATDVEIPVTLSVTVSDPDGDAMDVTFYDASDDSVIDTDTGVASGGTSSVAWSGLEAETEYSWYAKAYDGALWSAKSSTWSFTTAVWNAMVYDVDESGVIEIDELLDAIGDYIGGTISISQLLDVIDLYITG